MRLHPDPFVQDQVAPNRFHLEAFAYLPCRKHIKPYSRATGAGSDQPAKNRKLGFKYYELFGAKVLSGLAFMLLGEVITYLV